MDLGARHLRGWKEIAAYLKASERGVKRWEKTRGLPVHRVGGTTRDVVLALTDELDAWVGQTEKGQRDAEPQSRSATSGEVTHRGGDVSQNQESEVPGFADAHSPALRSWGVRRVPLPVAAGVAVACLLVAAYGLSGNGGSSASVKTATPPPLGTKAVPVLLELTSGASVRTRLRIRDGACGEFHTANNDKVELCPVLLGDALLLEIVDVSHPADRPYKMRLRLEQDSRVHVAKPVTFDVMWTTTAAGGRN